MFSNIERTFVRIFLISTILIFSLSAKDRVLKVINGTEIEAGSKPWLVSLQTLYYGIWQHNCGASIIDDEWLLTAGHCVDSLSPEDVTAYIGEVNLAGDGERVPVKEIYIHPRYNLNGIYENDIALLKLDSERFSEKERDILSNHLTLDSFDSDLTDIGTPVIAMGWGMTEDSFYAFDYPDGAREVDTEIMDCRRSSEYRYQTFTQDMFCADNEIEDILEDLEEKKGSCFGDSGGPMTTISNGEEIQIGIVSAGVGFSGANCETTGIYTKVQNYRDWISEVISGNYTFQRDTLAEQGSLENRIAESMIYSMEMKSYGWHIMGTSLGLTESNLKKIVDSVDFTAIWKYSGGEWYKITKYSSESDIAEFGTVEPHGGFWIAK
jgi:secreted trypsin-like serine protease